MSRTERFKTIEKENRPAGWMDTVVENTFP